MGRTHSLTSFSDEELLRRLSDLPDRRAGTTSPLLPIGPDAEVLSLGRRPEGGASVDRQLRPDRVAAREPELRSNGVAAAGDERLPAGAAVRPASPRARPAEVEPLAPGRYRSLSAKTSRQLRLLRAHGVIRKVPKTHRYRLTAGGQTSTAALFASRRANIEALLADAA